MQVNRIGLAVTCLTAFAVGQTYKVSTYNTIAPKKGDLSANQAFDKALTLFKALGKNVKGQVLQMRLQETPRYRTWEVVTSENNKTHYRLGLDSKTGKLSTFRDTDIETEDRRGQSKNPTERLTNVQFEGKVKKFLDLAGYKQKFTRFEIAPVSRAPQVWIRFYQEYKGLPVLDNGFGISLRASDGAFSYVASGFRVSEFEGTVKAKEMDARKKAQSERGTNEKPKEFRLWYARLQSSEGWRKTVSDVARPYYIAKYKAWDEVWIDAESGKVARHFRSQ